MTEQDYQLLQAYKLARRSRAIVALSKPSRRSMKAKTFSNRRNNQREWNKLSTIEYKAGVQYT